MASGRNGTICRKSAEEVPRHYADLLWNRRLEKPLERIARRCAVLGRRMWYSRVPRWQSTHQTLLFLGLAHRRSQKEIPGCTLLSRSLYTPENHARVGQTRFLTIVYLFHLAQYQSGINRICGRVNQNRPSRFLPSEFLAKHAGYSPVRSPKREREHLFAQIFLSGYVKFQRWNLRTGVWIHGLRSHAWQRRIFQLREIRVLPLGLEHSK